MSSLENLQDSSSLAVQLDRSRKEIVARYRQQQDREQLKREILEECARMIEQRVNIQVQNDALPQLRELDRAIKSLGRM